jgi:hypothetical protein
MEHLAGSRKSLGRKDAQEVTKRIPGGVETKDQ